MLCSGETYIQVAVIGVAKLTPDKNTRIAVQFKSPRARKDQQAFYKSLTNVDVCETDGISSELHLNQDGDDIKVEISRSELHFQEDKNRLTIYVPRNKQAQYVSFVDRLPSALLEWMLTEPSTGICDPLSRKALSAMQMIMQAPDNAVASTLLDRNGILSLEVLGGSGNSYVLLPLLARHQLSGMIHRRLPVTATKTARPGKNQIQCYLLRPLLSTMSWNLAHLPG